jgi:hypothetical protein
VTPAALSQVRAYRLSLYRTQLLIQIFPEENYHFFTVHSALSPTDALYSSTPCRTAGPAGRFRAFSPEPALTTPSGGVLTRRGRYLTLIVILAFGAFLLWTTLGSQHAECTVTASFNNARNTATASAASEAAALSEAQVAACGPLTQSMNDRIACSRTPPISRQCRSL